MTTALEDYKTAILGDPVDANKKPSRQGAVDAFGKLFKMVEGTLNVKSFNVVGDGVTDDTANIQLAVNAAQGKSLFFPNGDYLITSLPTNIDNVYITGDPFITFTDVKLPVFNGIFTGNKAVAKASVVLRYYTVADGVDADGWYLISVKSGANHDSILVGPVTASGDGSIIVDIDLDEYGISEVKWTPSGSSFGPDEGLATSGVVFGGSIGTDDFTLIGGFAHARESLVFYNGSSWSVSNGGFTVTPSTGSRLALTMTRTAKKSGHIGGSSYPSLTPHINNFSRPIIPFADATTEDTFLVFFWDLVAGAWITPGDANLSDIRFHISDAKSKGNGFHFGTDIGGTMNIWGEITYTLKEAFYP